MSVFHPWPVLAGILVILSETFLPVPISAAPQAMIFWLELQGSGAVRSAKADGSDAKVLVGANQGLAGPDGIAVDPSAGKIFWTNMNEGNPNGSVQKSNLDGSRVEYVVPPGGTHTPKQIQLDPVHGRLYWCDRDGFKIQRCNLDGTGLETLVSGLKNPVGMALDPAGGWFYFSDRNAGTLQRAPMAMPAGQTHSNRKDMETLASGLARPIDLALDLPKGKIYWTDRDEGMVHRADIEIPAGQTAADRKDIETLVRSLATPIGLSLDLAGGKLYYTEGASGAVGRANLDGSAKETLVPARRSTFLTGITFVMLPDKPVSLAFRRGLSVRPSGPLPVFFDALGGQLAEPGQSRPPRLRFVH